MHSLAFSGETEGWTIIYDDYNRLKPPNGTFDFCKISLNIRINNIYTMHNKFSNFLCFASLCAHLCAMSNNFKCNDKNMILGK